MPKYLVDANLPYLFSIWKFEEYIHQFDIDDSWSDEKIWEYAKHNNLTIITRESDFSNGILFSSPPPKVIHIRIGNKKLKEMVEILSVNWKSILDLSDSNKLVNVFNDRIKGIN